MNKLIASLPALAKALMVPVSAAVIALYPTYGHYPWFIAIITALGVMGVYSPSSVNAGQKPLESRITALEQRVPPSILPPRS